MLEIDAAGQRLDVAAAAKASTATVALPGMAVEMGRGFGEESGLGVGLCLLCRWREGPG
jgi:hypothetical protein